MLGRTSSSAGSSTPALGGTGRRGNRQGPLRFVTAGPCRPGYIGCVEGAALRGPARHMTSARAPSGRTAVASCVLAPTAGALLLGLAWLLVRPATADLAAQEYRTGLW